MAWRRKIFRWFSRFYSRMHNNNNKLQMCYLSHFPRSPWSTGKKLYPKWNDARSKKHYEFVQIHKLKEKKKKTKSNSLIFYLFLRRRINRWWRRKTCSTLYPNTPVKVKFSVSQDQPTAVNLIVSVSSRFRLFFSLSLENEVNIEWIRILSLLIFSIGFGLFAVRILFGCVFANHFIHWLSRYYKH